MRDEGLHSGSAAKVPSDTSPNGVYSGLRQQALTTKSGDVGITPSSNTAAWGVLMETQYDAVTVTLLAIADGTTSLYFSNGGGMIGGHGHETVRRANADFLAEVNNHLQYFQVCEEFPIPEPGHTIFYVLTDGGILSGGALENDLGLHKHPLSPVFHAGHEVITQFRLVTEPDDA